MKTFTIIAYVLPVGAHHVETVTALDATAGVLQLREKLQLAPAEFEVVAVARGALEFETVDPALVALAPYSSASP